MNNYTKEEVKQDNKIRLAKYDTLYIVCFSYIIIFGLNIFSYFAQSERPPESFMSYSSAMTGIFCLFLAVVLPFIISWHNKRNTKIYQSELKKPGDKLYYSQ